MKNAKEMSDVRDKSDNNMKMDSDKTTEVCMFTTFGKMSNFLVVFLHSLSTFLTFVSFIFNFIYSLSFLYIFQVQCCY